MTDAAHLPEAPTPSSLDDYNRVYDSLVAFVRGVEPLDAEWAPYPSPPDPLITQYERVHSAASFMRSEITIDRPLQAILDVINTPDEAARKKFEHDLDHFKEWPVEGSAPERAMKIVYASFKLQWPVSSRDFLTLTGMLREGDKTYLVSESINDAARAPHSSGYVRGYSKLCWVLQKLDENKTRVVRMAMVDPKGSIPAFLVKMKKAEDGNRLLNIKKVLGA
eukprot:m51a1_g14513 hypothetical protein (222) ;mRNA; r:835262-836117